MKGRKATIHLHVKINNTRNTLLAERNNKAQWLFFLEKNRNPVVAWIQGPCQNMESQLSDRHVGGIELNFLNNQISSGYFCQF